MSTNPEPGRPFRYSLRTFLIATCAVGLSMGLLGRLFLRNPELCMGIVGMLSTIGPFVLAVGTIVWIGLRGRRWGLTSWGVVLAVTPLVGIGAILATRYFLGPSSGNLDLRLQTNRQLLQQYLPKQVDQPWVWNELESRRKPGKLSPQEVDDAVKVLVAHMTSKQPQGWNQPLSWQNGFLSAATKAGMISPPVLFSLCDAFYGPQPIIQPLHRMREGKDGLQVEITYGNPWSSQNGLGVELLWQVERVLLDGKPVELQQPVRSGERWSGSCPGALKAGDHEVVVVVQCAYVNQAKLIGLNPSDLPIARWPEARKRWKQSVSAPLKSFTVDESIVSLTTDPDKSPGPRGGIKIDRLVVQADRDGKKKLVLKADFNADPSLCLPISYDVAVTLEGHPNPHKLGALWIVRNGNGSTSGGDQLEGPLDQLGPSIRKADVILTPNPSHVEQYPDVSEIWGKEVILRGVPLERLDLEAGGAKPR